LAWFRTGDALLADFPLEASAMTERDIFLAVLDLPDQVARKSYLESACAGDAARRARVEALLRAHEAAGSFLAEPAVAGADGGTTQALGAASDSAADDEPLGFLSPPQRAGSLGRIGHYEVLEVLGRGGFGIVLRAFDDVLQRVVAVKVLAPEMAATSPARKRFLREARSSAQVRHENVVQVYAVEEQPLPYLVMEFIPGETLQQRLDRTGPLDVPEVLRVGRQVAEGLAAAHAQGLIHRDIKPANVLIEGGARQRVKLTDFGLARAADDASISQSGIVAGTPMYMAPEQARGETLDHRADLFSLGSVLYALLTGHPPFRAATTLAVLKRVTEDEPRPIREAIPEVPEWFCRIVGKLLAKDPAERFQSAREVADLLADCEMQWKAHAGLKDFSRIPGVRSPGWKRRTTRGEWIALGLAVIATLLAVWLGRFAFLYASNRGELVLMPRDGLVSLIVLQNDEGVLDGDKLLPSVTDWLGMKEVHSFKLPPGKYQLNAGTNRKLISNWEVTTSGPLQSDRRLLPGEGLMGWSVIVTVGRGERVTVRALLRDEPAPAVGSAPKSVPAPAGPADDRKSDQAKIQGTWKGMSADTQGQPIPEIVFKAVGPSVTFSGDKVTWKANPTPEARKILGDALATFSIEGVFHLDPTKAPKAIDLIVLGPNAKTPLGTPVPRAMLGIYNLEGDSLEICIAVDPEHAEERPAKFGSVPGKFISHIKLRRDIPSSAVVQGLRDLVAAKERTFTTTELRFEAGQVSPVDRLLARIELSEARARLAEAEGDRAAMLERLKELVTFRDEERRLISVLVEAGRAARGELDQADARVAEAKTRLAQAQSATNGSAAPAEKP
jgi:uncharacterized protein (TIGR03067 family)